MKKAIIIFSTVLAGCSSEPKTYEDCILKYVKENLDRAAVAQIVSACEAKYPRTAQPAADEQSGVNPFDKEIQEYNKARYGSQQSSPSTNGASQTSN